MITPKMLKYGLIILAGAIALAIVFFGCPGNKNSEVPVITSPKKIVADVVNNEAVYKAKFDSINAVNEDLKSANEATLTNLSAAQAYGNLLARKLKQRAAGDTTIVAGGEESNNGTIAEFIANSETRDTLCNNAIDNLQHQVSNRDQLITAKDSLYSNLRSSFDFTIQQQEDLLKYNKTLKKQLSRKKFGNGFWKVTTIAAGLFILKQKL